jgi:uncharacterized protein (TIGR02231 family)
MRSALVAAAFVILAVPATAAEVKGTSAISGVTVFPSGAEVTRVTRVRIAEGDHVVLLTDLPAQAVPGSVRVEGKSSGRLEIGSVDTRRLAVPRTDPEVAASARRALELEIEKLKDSRAVTQAASQAAETQKLFISKLIELPARLPSGGPQGSVQLPDWNQLYTTIGERTLEAQKVVLETSVRLRDIDRQIADLEKKLVALAPAQEERTEVKVFVTAGAALDAELSIRYQVVSANWAPLYDARLTTGARNEAPRLTLVRRASILQRSGEDWTDVTLSLSTTRPGSGTAAPELYAMLVDFESDAPARPVASGAAVRSIRPMAQEEKAAGEAGEVQQRKRLEAMNAVGERQASVETAPFQAIFGVPGAVTVLTTGETKRVQIDEAQLDPALTVRVVPRVDARAFLYAKVTLPKTTPYLPGQVSLFRDATFVGSGRLPQLAPGEEHELGFGADDSIRVRHAVLDEKRGESGIITSSKTDQRNYRIAVKNHHPRVMTVAVLDQIPVSQNQDIKVELIAKTAPTRKDPDDKRGVMAWDIKLEPNEEKQVEFGYRVSWPADKRVRYGR